MSQDLIQQFTITRNALIQNIGKLGENVLVVIPEGFRNNIHWHIGHILTVNEQLIFGFPNKSKELPENNVTLFGNGSKPADWAGDVPSVATLTEQLKDQLERVKQIPHENFKQKLSKPLFGQDTVGGLVAFSVYHEANHVGQIHAMNHAAKAHLG